MRKGAPSAQTTHAQNVQNDTQAPHVNTVVVWFLAPIGRANNLWSKVLRRPRHSLTPKVAHKTGHSCRHTSKTGAILQCINKPNLPKSLIFASHFTTGSGLPGTR